MKFIVTGFDAFSAFAHNPSELTANALPDFVKVDETGQAAKVAKFTLPTCCHDSWAKLKAEVDQAKNEKYAILLSGLAGGRDKICLERFALNVRQYRGPDNNGHAWDEEHIEKDAADAIRTRVRVKDIANELNSRGYACDISNHAGTFVCNELYFRALLEYNDDPNCLGVLFVHIPQFEDYKHSDPSHKDPRKPQEIFRDAFVDILIELSKIPTLA